MPNWWRISTLLDPSGGLQLNISVIQQATQRWINAGPTSKSAQAHSGCVIFLVGHGVENESTLAQSIAFTATPRSQQCTYSIKVTSLGASLLLNIFLSFEVGIAHAIANFK